TIVFPYKRYQIQNVWRAEKPQKGRYREFTQCDADTIGSESVICDAEFIQMGIEALQMLGFKKFRANISNRKLLNGIVEFSGATNEQFIPICLSIDKLPKIGGEVVKKELMEKRKISAEISDKILNLVSLQGNTQTLIDELKKELKNTPVGMEGLKELEQIFDYLQKSKIPEEFYVFSPYIARGLAYYNGPIWEFEVPDGGVGSIGGCGRYDNTIGKFVGRPIPATGGSFGIDRIVEIVKERKMFQSTKTPTQVLVTLFDETTFDKSLEIANELRKNNIPTMLFPKISKLDKQFKYADRKGIPYVVMIGPDEVKKNIIKMKDMKKKEQRELNLKDLLQLLKNNAS
ncbi:MAG: histidine--tRNA ligase, partial [bacterium]|nr:histidine--tRNA ligase [bacterium]